MYLGAVPLGMLITSGSRGSKRQFPPQIFIKKHDGFRDYQLRYPPLFPSPETGLDPPIMPIRSETWGIKDYKNPIYQLQTGHAQAII